LVRDAEDRGEAARREVAESITAEEAHMGVAELRTLGVAHMGVAVEEEFMAEAEGVGRMAATFTAAEAADDHRCPTPPPVIPAPSGDQGGVAAATRHFPEGIDHQWAVGSGRTSEAAIIRISAAATVRILAVVTIPTSAAGTIRTSVAVDGRHSPIVLGPAA